MTDTPPPTPAEVLRDLAWNDEDRAISFARFRVKQNLRKRVMEGTYMPTMAAGAWRRVADLASQRCAERIKDSVPAPFEAWASSGRYAHPRATRNLCAALMAEHFDSHLEQVEEELDND
mgnify:CR=1 FL=1